MLKVGKSEKGFGFDVDKTVGSTPQINTWTSEWIEFYGVHILGYQLKLSRQQYGDSLIYEKAIAEGQRLVKNTGPLFDLLLSSLAFCMETCGVEISAPTKMANLSYSTRLVTVNHGLAVDTPAPGPLDAGNCTLVPNGCGSNELGREEIEARSVELRPEHLASEAKSLNEISLYQRLMAALVPEEENQVLTCSGKECLRISL